LLLQVTREYRITHRADLESEGKRMAFTLMETWPSLCRESCFMDELAFVMSGGKRNVAEIQADAKNKLILMKQLVAAFEAEVRLHAFVILLFHSILLRVMHMYACMQCGICSICSAMYS
jgi:hypothetical protein